MSGTLTLSGMAAGLPSGEQILGPVTMTGLSVVGQLDGGNLAVGDNSFAVPTGAVAVALFLGSAGSAATVKLRTNLNSGDGGLQIAPFSNIGWAAFPLPAGSTSVILNASASLASIAVAFI